MTPGDIDLLIHRYFEGALSDEEETSLEELLKTDPAAADRFVELSELESGMVESLKADDDMPSAVYAVVHGMPRRSRARSSAAERRLWPYGVAAALFIAALLLHLRTSGGPPVQPETAPPGPVAREPLPRAPEPRPAPALPDRSKAELEADRLRQQEAIREIERRTQDLEEARKEAEKRNQEETRKKLERQLAEAETERHEAAAKLVKVDEALARPEPTRILTGPVLEAVEGEVAWIGDVAKPARVGEIVSAGAGLVTRGPRSRAVLVLVDETRIDLRGDSRLEGIQGNADQKIFTLAQGTLAATVSKQPASRSIVFLTPHAELTVLGTRLLLQVGPEETRLDVEEGRVRNRRLSDKKTIEVLANHTVTTAKAGPLVAKPLPLVRSFQDGVLPTPDYSGTRDTSIGNSSPTATSGTLDLLRLYREPRGDLQNLVLIKWDISSIPAKSKVVSAELSFWVTGALSPPGARAYEVRTPWDELEASWRFARVGVPWDVRPGKDVLSTPLATIAPTVNGWSSFPLNEAGVALVQRWILNAPGNAGIAIVKEPPNAWDLNSREWATVEHRPKLTVTVLPPAK
jgi:ferric-dicitrate binding protein FerR (iron transport regulator)